MTGLFDTDPVAPPVEPPIFLPPVGPLSPVAASAPVTPLEPSEALEPLWSPSAYPVRPRVIPTPPAMPRVTLALPVAPRADPASSEAPAPVLAPPTLPHAAPGCPAPSEDPPGSPALSEAPLPASPSPCASIRDVLGTLPRLCRLPRRHHLALLSRYASTSDAPVRMHRPALSMSRRCIILRFSTGTFATSTQW